MKSASGLSPSALAERVTRSQVEPLERAERMLAEIETADDALKVIAYAEVARVMAKRMSLGTMSVNHATAIKMRAERRLAEAIDAGQNDGSIAIKGQHGVSSSDSEDEVTTLAQLGIKAPRLKEARLIRDAFTDAQILAAAAAASGSDKELARNTLLRRARDEAAKGEQDDKRRRTEAALNLPREADLRNGDFRQVLTDIWDVDAIVTDPPYPKEFIGLFGDLAEFADRVLSSDGVLVVMSGQTHLPAVFAQMEGFRPYRWTAAYMTPGAGYASHARRVQSNWKPILVYGGGPRFGDVFSSDADDKRFHEWGQSFGGIADLVERLTEPEALVCDPFMGGGTTAAAALSLGRRFVGCDIDPDAVQAAKERIA